jgi:polyhydroxyalkanoate synthesis regulator phasin
MRIFSRLLLIALVAQPIAARAELYYLIVAGLGGDPTYVERFADDAAAMVNAAERTLGDSERIKLLSGDQATLEAIRSSFADLSASTAAADRLAVFLVGHGSYDGTQYKFNLTGADIDGAELNDLLATVPAQSQLIVNMTSASGSVLESWAGDGRAVITATRSGSERNATRFAQYWATALSAEDADLNKNGSISAQEAFDYASRLVADSYEAEGGLATEHPELRGDAASAFEISRLTARVSLTPELAELNSRLGELEEQVAALRLRRDELGDDYLPQLQNLLVELALVQEQIDEASAE